MACATFNANFQMLEGINLYLKEKIYVYLLLESW